MCSLLVNIQMCIRRHPHTNLFKNVCTLYIKTFSNAKMICSTAKTTIVERKLNVFDRKTVQFGARKRYFCYIYQLQFCVSGLSTTLCDDRNCEYDRQMGSMHVSTISKDKRTTVGSPTKRHSNGVSLAGR